LPNSAPDGKPKRTHFSNEKPSTIPPGCGAGILACGLWRTSRRQPATRWPCPVQPNPTDMTILMTPPTTTDGGGPSAHRASDGGRQEVGGVNRIALPTESDPSNPADPADNQPQPALRGQPAVSPPALRDQSPNRSEVGRDRSPATNSEKSKLRGGSLENNLHPGRARVL
jgi:hypothetical protein